MEPFETFGYYKEYWIGGKFIGIENNVTKDRDVLGFFGAKIHTTTTSITLSNGKTIKPGTRVTTQLHYLNGIKNKNSNE